MKKSGSGKYDAFMKVWLESTNARKEKDLAKAQRYKSFPMMLQVQSLKSTLSKNTWMCLKLTWN